MLGRSTLRGESISKSRPEKDSGAVSGAVPLALSFGSGWRDVHLTRAAWDFKKSSAGLRGEEAQHLRLRSYEP